MNKSKQKSNGKGRREILYKRIPEKHILPAILFLIIEGVLSPAAFSDTWQIQLIAILLMATIACFFIHRFFPDINENLKNSKQIEAPIVEYLNRLKDSMLEERQKAIEQNDIQEIALKEAALNVVDDIKVYCYGDENVSKNIRSNIRFYLYCKSNAQYKRNIEETNGHALSCFRKPDLFEISDSLFRYGKPDSTIISLDEYWIKDLAKKGFLNDLSSFAEGHIFLDSLLKSGYYNKAIWSVPHFVDFSYYTYRKKSHYNLRKWISDISSDDNIDSYLLDLSNKTSANRLLIYDFHTPDTIACVMLEFISAFGDGIKSLTEKRNVISNRNIRALKILRGMTGKFKYDEVFVGEPLNFDFIKNEIPFIRCWHSRMDDMPITRKNYAPILGRPIYGTLGGWHVGILSNGPYNIEAMEELSSFLSDKNQKTRFLQGAGLPTLAKFYKNPDFARQSDKITEHSLKDLHNFFDKLIRRSEIDDYTKLRQDLCDLHNDIMLNDIINIKDIYIGWCEKI